MVPLRVAHVITDLQVGGEAVVLSWLLPALRSRGIESRVFALTSNANDPAECETLVMRELRRAGIDVVDLGVRPLGNPSWCVRLIREIRAFHPAVVHSYLFHAVLVAAGLRLLPRRPPLVSSVVSLDPLRNAGLVAAERLSLRAADRIVVNARAVEAQFAEHPYVARRLTVQYHGVDIERIACAPAADRSSFGGGSPLIAFIGRLHVEKGPEVALRVLAALRKDHPGARLLFVGGGPLSAKMRALASAMGLSDAVLFAGPVSNAEVFGLLKAVDILLVPSWREGLPGVVLEAFAAQTPVVATAVGGIPEVVSHEGTGLLAPAGAEAELAALCGRLVNDDVLRRRLVRRAFERVQAFPAARLVDARARVYHELAS